MIGLIVRSDLRLKFKKVAACCAAATAALLARLPLDSTEDIVCNTYSTKYRASDVCALKVSRDIARSKTLNHFMYTDDKTGVPLVLAIGPVPPTDLFVITKDLKLFRDEELPENETKKD